MVTANSKITLIQSIYLLVAILINVTSFFTTTCSAMATILKLGGGNNYYNEKQQLSSTNHYQRWHQCPTSIVSVAPSKQEQFDKYPFREVGLTIYQNLKIPCNGVLVQWNFITTLETVWGLHLAVFRPTTDKADVRNYRMIGETYINGIPFDLYGEVGAWVSYRTEEQIEVQAGDFIGVFYDNGIVQSNEVAICTQQKQVFTNNDDDGNAIVVLQSAQDLAASDYVVNGESAFRTSRYAALSAFVTSPSLGRGFLMTLNDETPPPLVSEAPLSTTPMAINTTAISTKTKAPIKTRSAGQLNSSKSLLQIPLPRIDQTFVVNNGHGKSGTTTKPLLRAGNLLPSLTDRRCWGLPKVMAKVCSSWVARFYFDAASSKCLQFLSCNASFLGPRTPDTAFRTKAECLRACWQFPTSDSVVTTTTTVPTTTTTEETTSTTSSTSTTTTTTSTTTTTTTPSTTPPLPPTTEPVVSINVEETRPPYWIRTVVAVRARETGRHRRRRKKQQHQQISSATKTTVISTRHYNEQTTASSQLEHDIVETAAPQIEGKISAFETAETDLMPTFILQNIPERQAFYMKNSD